VIAWVLSACGGGAPTAPPSPPPAGVASITVTPEMIGFTGLGEELTLVATARDQQGSPMPGVSVSWSSNDPSVVTVSDGAATSVGDGEAVLTASAGGVSVAVPVTVHVWSSISTGGRHTCALSPGGTVYCWGDNEHGQLGQDATTLFEFNQPLPVPAAPLFQSISSGHEHTCGVTAVGGAFCWGNNRSGQLGDGTTAARREVPVQVAGGLSFASISAGAIHTCGLTTGGQAYCWGFPNLTGVLGDGTTNGSNTPVAVAGGHTFRAISVGFEHSCAITDAGATYCWGNNNFGRLGIGLSGGVRTTPTETSGGLVFESFTAFSGHACGLTAVGTAHCWGKNDRGEIGNGTIGPVGTPARVSAGLTFASVSAGAEMSCGVTRDGAAYCWGLNHRGQLGNAETTDSPVPTRVVGEHDYRAISAGGLHACGLTTGFAAYCWGDNELGALGTGDDESGTAIPRRVADR
jgi:alpha-tubulin suppressor-like RCC1 family protein